MISQSLGDEQRYNYNPEITSDLNVIVKYLWSITSEV